VADPPTSTITTTSEGAPPPTSAAPTAQPTEIDLEINVTVFFDPITVTDTGQAEAVILAIIGDEAVDSITIISRTEAWRETQALAARLPTPIHLDPALQPSPVRWHASWSLTRRSATASPTTSRTPRMFSASLT
jgi:hypothetical protein